MEYYLVTDGPNKLDKARVQAHEGGVKGKETHFYFVHEGTLCSGQPDLGTAVDKVKGQSRAKPAQKKATP